MQVIHVHPIMDWMPFYGVINGATFASHYPIRKGDMFVELVFAFGLTNNNLKEASRILRERHHNGVALCSTKDQFSRKIGYMIAVGRLDDIRSKRTK